MIVFTQFTMTNENKALYKHRFLLMTSDLFLKFKQMESHKR